MSEHSGQRIAVIGAGVAGLAAAWALGQRHEVTLYEKDERLGGHANTVDVDYDGVSVAVDTGFIVYNNINYPNLVALFETLGVETQPSDMSFGVSFDHGWLEWAGDSVGTYFAQKRNLLRLSHHAMWRDILRFNKQAQRDIAEGSTEGVTLGAYLERRKFGTAFRDRYLLPMGAAIWSMPNADMLGFPAKSFLEFFDNHGLLSGFNTFQWRTVTGGSRSYVAKLVAAARGHFRTGCGATKVTRRDDGVDVVDAVGATTHFDQVVLACHSDQALALLDDSATKSERDLLGAIRYAPNRAVLHRDASLMPKRRAVWSSWNYVNDGRPGLSDGPVSLTYWMNRLQGIDPARPLFVTLNPAREPRPDLTFAAFDYHHPQFDHAADVAQRRLQMIQGTQRTWFCGAYCGHGFHEDGLASALEVAARLGAAAPWGKAGRPRIYTPMAEAAE